MLTIQYTYCDIEWNWWTNTPITNAGILTHVTPQRKLIKFSCYVFDTPIGNTQEMSLLGLKTIVEANIDIRYHMKSSVQGVTTMVRFLEEKETRDIKSHRVEMLYYKISECKFFGK